MPRPDRHRDRGRRGGRGPRRRDRRPSGDERLSRFLAFVLRHHPEEIGLELDERGACDLEALLEGIRSRPGFERVTREQVERLVTSGPGAARFTIEDGRIRARYGHSLEQPVQYEAADPPEILFHGTTPEAAEQVLAEGLTAGQRQRVHLSVDTPAAREVGRRRCPDPVILQVDTECARKAGVRFYRGGPAVWLSDDIPPECITRAE
ncbi:MAG: RNA 2'-phosphotransferase [Phycisphaerae bacterium]